MRKALFLIVAALAVGGAGSYVWSRPPAPLVLTGIVTTNDVLVSPQIAGQISRLEVAEGDHVKKDQLLAVITPDELKAESASLTHSAEAASSQVQASEAALRYQELQTTDQIRQAESTLAATESQVDGAAADLANARLINTRTQSLAQQGVASVHDRDQARTAYE